MAILEYLERFLPGTPENPPRDLSKSEWTQETVRFHVSEKSSQLVFSYSDHQNTSMVRLPKCSEL